MEGHDDFSWVQFINLSPDDVKRIRKLELDPTLLPPNDPDDFNRPQPPPNQDHDAPNADIMHPDDHSMPTQSSRHPPSEPMHPGDVPIRTDSSTSTRLIPRYQRPSSPRNPPEKKPLPSEASSSHRPHKMHNSSAQGSNERSATHQGTTGE